MNIYAISDLHVPADKNKKKLEGISSYPEDMLILAGDICERIRDLEWTFSLLREKFKKLCWVPGNHELWSVSEREPHHGEDKYFALIELCDRYSVLHPESEYSLVQVNGDSYFIAPLFLLYDYSFHPPNISDDRALEWAAEDDIVCADEYYLKPNPYASRSKWCEHRVQLTENRLQKLDRNIPIVLINHFQLRQDLVFLPRIPRFSIWCGTKRTENWHTQFNVAAVVSGHLHVRYTQFRDNVRFEEVSLGNPGQYDPNKSIDQYLRKILPYKEIGQKESIGFF